MKKIIIFIIIAGIVLSIMCTINKVDNQSFSVDEYKEYINAFSTNITLGYISNAKKARQEAEKIWIEIYGNKVKKNKPYNIKYDKKNNIWLVYGSIKRYELGGVPYILIKKDNGKVLAVWHDK